MSIKLMSQIWECEGLDSYERLVALCLADHANDDGQCYPSIGRLCARTGMKKRGVQTVMKRLIERGYLAVEMNAGPKGVNLYTVHVPAESEAAPPHSMHPASDAPPPHSTTPPPHSTARTPASGAPEPLRTIKEPSINASTSFDAFWKVCPRKIGKGAARRAFEKITKTEKPSMLIEAMRVYSTSTAGTDPKYIVHPATWLNQERWADETPIIPQPVDTQRSRYERIASRYKN